MVDAIILRPIRVLVFYSLISLYAFCRLSYIFKAIGFPPFLGVRALSL